MLRATATTCGKICLVLFPRLVNTLIFSHFSAEKIVRILRKLLEKFKIEFIHIKGILYLALTFGDGHKAKMKFD